MGETLIIGLALLGLLAPLLPGWRAVLIATALFAVLDGVVLLQIHDFLATEARPGPGARMGVFIAYVPTIAFLLGCLLRALFMLARTIVRLVRTRSRPADGRDTPTAPAEHRPVRPH